MQLSSMWTPGSSFKNDADGTPVLGTWESPFYDTQKVFTQRWRWAYLLHDLRDAASDAPTWTVSYCTSPEAGAAYTALSPTIGATTKKQTDRLPINVPSKGIGLKVTRQNAAAFARLYGVGAVAYEREK
jgi:hypothetical protein